MIVLLLLALGTAFVAIGGYAYWAKRRDEMPEELRGDWWTQFEAEFREYARRFDGADGIRRKPGDGHARQRRSPHGRDLSF